MSQKFLVVGRKPYHVTRDAVHREIIGTIYIVVAWTTRGGQLREIRVKNDYDSIPVESIRQSFYQNIPIIASFIDYEEEADLKDGEAVIAGRARAVKIENTSAAITI